MRYFCVAVLLAWTVGSAEVLVADQQPSAGELKGAKPREQPPADVPEAFRFLFHSPAQHDQEVKKRPTYLVYEEELWKGLPYDSISLERLLPGGSYVRSSERNCRWENEVGRRLWATKTRRVVGDSAGV